MKNKILSILSIKNIIYAWIIIFGFIPIFMIILTSFLSKNDISIISLPFTINNYFSLFNTYFFIVLLRSILIASSTTLICLLIAYPFSYILIKSQYKSLLLILITIPFWTSSLIRTYALLAIFKKHGLLNTILLKLHIINYPLNMLYTNITVILGLIYTLFPFMVLSIYTQMEKFNFKLIEAALDLGASRWQAFTKVLLPGTKNGVIAGSLIVFLPSMTFFYIPNILGGAKSMLLGNIIQNQFLLAGNWPQGAATSSILIAFVALILKVNKHNND